jgi:AcrR family transcriptional regulator
MGRSHAPSNRSRGDVADKRAALLDAALELFARDGLQNVSTAAIAEAAGVASGTLFVYFETKQELINELYLEVVGQYTDVVTAAVDPASSRDVRLRAYWYALARWHLNHRAAANVMLQFEASSALTPETEARKDAMEAEMVATHFPDADLDRKGPLYRHVVHAMTAGPIRALAHMREKGAVEITDELLEQTFTRVKRALLPEG